MSSSGFFIITQTCIDPSIGRIANSFSCILITLDSLYRLPQVLCSPNAPPSTALELVRELLHSGVKEYILTLPHNRLYAGGRDRGDWKAQPLPLRFVKNILLHNYPI